MNQKLERVYGHGTDDRDTLIDMANDDRLDAFVSFPSPYTQTLIVQALIKLVPSLSLSLVPPPEDHPPRLQW